MTLKLSFSNQKFECGTDEAGRGCLAGPVTAAAVILPKIFKNELLPISFVQLTDGYLLKDKSLKSNVIPLLKNLFLNSDHQYKVDFLFKELKNKIKDKQEAELS